MASSQSLHMNPGEGEESYARNSALQSAEQNRMKPITEEAVLGLVKSINGSSLVIADLGCSSGPNALTLVSAAIDAVLHNCRQQEQPQPPELSVFLNDLPDNDFNSVAKSLVAFQQRMENSCRVLAGMVPGSFYKRLFRSNSVDLFVSSNSLQWLSEVPEDLKRNGIPMCTEDEFLRQERRPLVHQAYARQFRKDFTLFLNLRAQELVPGGRMDISLLGSRDSHCSQPWEVITSPLNDMALRGLIRRELFDTLYIPLHGTCDVELRQIIEEEGSFKINKLQVHGVMSGMDKGLITPMMTAQAMRAIFEPIILQHFGPLGDVMDEFVRTLAHMILGTPHLGDDRVLLCVSLTRRN